MLFVMQMKVTLVLFQIDILLEDQPLKVLFGMIICGYVIGSDEGVLYIRGEYPKSIEAINGCINQLKKKVYLEKIF